MSRDLAFQFLGKSVPSESFHDTVKLTGILASISSMLQQYSSTDIIANANLMRLVRVLAAYKPDPLMLQYVSMPPQEDPSLEELRLAAVDNMAESHEAIALRKMWEPVIIAAKVDKELSDEDEHLRGELRNILVCPVLTHGVNTIHRIQGWSRAYQFSTDNGHHSVFDSQSLTPSLLFLETCSGFRGQTTSRLEDETICLGILLGTNVTEIQGISTMDWRMKERLLSVDSKPLIATFLRLIGLDVRRWIQRCHEERMKVLLRQIGNFPASIIFWEAPRLRFDGWRWAPYSVMHRSMTHEIWVGGRCGFVKDDGIEVQVRAFRLRRLTASHPDASEVKTLGKSASDMHLVIHTDHDTQPEVHPWRRTWQSIRVRRTYQGYSPRAIQSWNEYAVKGPIDRLAILMEEGQGVLVHEYGERNGVRLVRHVELVERVGIDAKADLKQALHVGGTWTPDDTWCVG